MEFFPTLLSGLAEGFEVAFAPSNLVYAFVGALLGTAIGVLPGLGAPATIALLLPATYTLDPVPAVILQEAFLSFLGLGVQPPDASWGTLVSDGARVLALFPWLVIFPGVALSLTLLCFNFLGDGLRDALDPKSR